MTTTTRALVLVILCGCGQASAPPSDAKTKAAAAKTDDTKTTGDTKIADTKAGGTKTGDGTAKPPAPKAFAKDDKAGVAAAFKAATGTDLGDDACFEWPSSFPRVALIGGFANDRGCALDEIFVDGELHTTDADVAGVATRDFKAAVLADKEAIARAWVDEVLHAFGGGFVTEASVAFEIEGSPKFERVRATENKIGGVVVEGWVARPSGMVYESTFDYRVYRFSPDGAVEAETRNSFTVPGEKLRAAEEKKPGP